jgi:2-polyprenyl-3-methyl-5-hydroxy-6-metoxy-1,4-benzoquinol methylase
MERKYWEQMAPAYNEEIFDVLKNDKKAIIRKAIQKVAATDKSVLDAGCAIGKWLPVLAPAFKQVVAADISAKNLAIAKKTFSQFVNVEYVRMDMSAAAIQLPAYDVVVCINAILTSSEKKRSYFFHNISRSLKTGGTLILVVPSLESWLMTRIFQHKWSIDKKLFAQKITAPEAASRYKNMQQGNVEIDNVATKHYLQEELQLLLSLEGLQVKKCQKINYDWSTEFVVAPGWLQEPQPWDWLVIAEKK